MSFENKYRLLEAIPDLNGTPDEELLGREVATGRPVVVHLLGTGKASENEALMRRAKSLAADHNGPVLETGEYRGRHYVVTEVLPGNLRLRKWIAQTAPPQEQPPPAIKPPLKPEANAAPGPGEFTRLFQAVSSPAAEVPAAESEPQRPVRHEPGEFTRLFNKPEPSAAPTSPELAETQLMEVRRPAPPSPIAERHAPPESKPQFQAQSPSPVSVQPASPVKMPDPAPSAPPPPKTDPQPGEFTLLFRAPVQPNIAESSAPVESELSKPPASAPPSHEPGEFTRMFQAPIQSSEATPAGTGELAASPVPFESRTGIGPSVGAPVSTNANLPAPPAAVKPEPNPEPGEFTRLFQAPAAPVSPPPARPAPPAPVHSADATRLFPSTPQKGPGAIAVPSVPRRVAVQRPPGATPLTPPGAAPSQSNAGEFTKLFQAPSSQNPATPPPPEHSQAGEFTRMFESPSGPKPPVSPASPAFPQPAGSPLEQAGPGEFTRMFQSPLAGTSGTQPLNHPSSPAPPGEFTRMLDTPFASSGSTSNRPANPPPPPRPAPPPSQGPGEFTRMFGAQGSATGPSNPPSRPASDATGAFMASHPPPAAPAQPAEPAGPGEYTRLFSAPPPPAPAPTASAPKPKPAGKGPAVPPKTSYTTLIIVLAVLLVIAIALILFFALRK